MSGLGSLKSVPVPTATVSDAELLAKLEAANREFEQDQKSLSSLTPPKVISCGSVKGHSRQASVSSVTSNISQCSNVSNIDFEPASTEELWNLWSRIVSEWDSVSKRKQQYVKDLVRRGIPHHFRGIVWQLLCGAHDDPARYRYADYLKQTSPMEKMIRRDITRTYPDHEFFKEKDGLGQESLFNVMKAYSLHDREVGYCQGSGFIVGLLLMQMPEEEAFSVLVKLMQDYNMRELFKPSMSELGLFMYQLEYLIQELLPQLYSHFQAQSFSVSMFASSWFLTVFTTSLSTQIVCRIFDIFLLEGTDFIFRVAIAILQLCEERLLSLDMEGMIKCLSKEGLQSNFEEPEQILSTSAQVKYSSKKMKKLEKEYNTLKSKEQEEQVELRRLRTENRLLRQRIDNLEKETATLADRLIHDQVKYAQQQESVLSLRKQLSIARQTSSDTNHRLEELNEQYEQLKTSSSGSSQASLEMSLPEVDQNRLQRLTVEVRELRDKEITHSQKISQQNTRIKELENLSEQLRTEPSTQLVSVQEELIACKLREAEANLSLKELQQKFYDLHKQWQKHMEKLKTSSPGSKLSKSDLRHMTDEVMSLRLREAQAVAELKDTKQNLMELETQNHISARQIKRTEAEKRKLEENLDTESTNQRALHNTIQELERKIETMESQRKEEEMMSRIRDAEHSQLVAEMRQKVAELEIENQELLTEGQLVEKGEKGNLHNQIADLQDEVLQLRMSGNIGETTTNPISSMTKRGVSLETDTDDYESDDLEMTMRASSLKLCLTESMCGVELQNALSNRPRNDPLDTSDTDTPDQQDTAAKTRRKRKKQYAATASKDGIDLDKTPTQDNIDTQCFLVESNELSDIDKRGDCNGVLSTDGVVLSSSIDTPVVSSTKLGVCEEDGQKSSSSLPGLSNGVLASSEQQEAS